MADKIGHFVWHELHTDNVEKSKKYYAEVLGWKEMSMDMPGGEPYLMLAAGEKQQMGVMKSPMEGAPPHFAQYLSVEDVDATAALAEKEGGKIIVPATDIPVGRFAVITDPQGAAFALWKSQADDEEGGSTEFHWNELWSPNAAEIVGFYEKVFGFTSEKMEMSDLKDPYIIFKKGENMACGAMTSPMEGVPAMWLPYIKVDDVDATIERAKARGGEVLGPVQEQPGIGKFAVVKESQGAVVGFITPAEK